MSSGQPFPSASDALNSSSRSACNVVRHFGKPRQLMNGPRFPCRITICFFPHFGHTSPVSTGGGLGGNGNPVFLSKFKMPLHAGYPWQDKNGPNRPTRLIINFSHSGHLYSVNSCATGLPSRSTDMIPSHSGYREHDKNRFPNRDSLYAIIALHFGHLYSDGVASARACVIRLSAVAKSRSS